MVMNPRRDLLAECNDKAMPFDAFQKEWCSRCLNLECTRSIAGKSKFEARVSTWEDRLFLNPPSMSSDDPRFSKIKEVAQRFITIDVSRTPEVKSAWLDPRDLSEPEPSEIPRVSTSQPSPAYPPTKIAELVSEEARQPTPQDDTRSLPSAPAPVNLALSNAPNQSGKVLPSPPSASIPKPDPWAAPAPPDPADQIILPGTRVKLHGSGV